MVDVILVEESLSESALACIAIALRRPSARVAEARNLSEAKRIVEGLPGGKALVILGWRALRNGLDAFLAAAAGRATVIGLAADLGEPGKERALRAGVRAIYEKPADWREYVAAVEAILGDWLEAGVPASGRP
jgi:DNA-binding response OmpR family regulator